MKVVVLFNKLNIGGAERSTLELVNGFCSAGHDVTLFVNTRGGALESELLPGVKTMYFYHDIGVLREWNRRWSGLLKLPIKNLLDAGFQFLLGVCRKVFYRIRRPRFDLGITSFNGIPANHLNKYTRCDVRIKMIRSERPIVFNGVPYTGRGVFAKELNSGELECFVCVSKHIRESMLKYCEIAPNRVHAVYNLKTPFDKIKHEDYFPEEYTKAGDYLKIVTVCRLHEATKGLVRMAEVAQTLKDRGYKFKWFIVGDGVDRLTIEKAIKEKGLEDTMILCGFKQDPYSYYKYADLVAVLSYVEGFCGAVTEAKLLEKPIIVTNFAVEEQIQHGINGYIVENNTEAIIEGMEHLLGDAKLRKSLAINGLAPEILDNDIKIRQFEELYNTYKSNRRDR